MEISDVSKIKSRANKSVIAVVTKSALLKADKLFYKQIDIGFEWKGKILPSLKISILNLGAPKTIKIA